MSFLPDPAARPAVSPDLAVLRQAGWSVQSVTGNYAVAWSGPAEVVFVWRDGGWHRLAARTAPAAKAA